MTGLYYADTQYFNPRQISGLKLWLDASDPNANGTLPSNGASISSWKDKSGVGNDYSQGTGANQPTFNTNQIAGKGAITFAANKFMSGGSTGFPSGSGARTWFAVVNTTSASSTSYIFLYGTNAFVQYWSTINIGSPFTTNSSLFIDIDGRGSYTSDFSFVNSTNYILEANYTAGQNVSQTGIIVNGVTKTDVPNIDAVPNTVLANAYVSSNGSGAGGNAWIGQIAEIILYNSSLSAANQGLVRRYLANKWSISA